MSNCHRHIKDWRKDKICASWFHLGDKSWRVLCCLVVRFCRPEFVKKKRVTETFFRRRIPNQKTRKTHKRTSRDERFTEKKAQRNKGKTWRDKFECTNCLVFCCLEKVRFRLSIFFFPPTLTCKIRRTNAIVLFSDNRISLFNFLVSRFLYTIFFRVEFTLTLFPSHHPPARRSNLLWRVPAYKYQKDSNTRWHVTRRNLGWLKCSYVKLSQTYQGLKERQDMRH